jgi:hypothetical protein
MGLKQGAIWENPWGIYWELIGSLKGTYWEQRKKEKTGPLRTHECMLSLLIESMKLFISKTVCHHF